MTFRAEVYPRVESREARLAAHEIELQEIIQELLKSREGFLGKGKAAEIHESKVNPAICYKIITKPLSNPEYINDVNKEQRLTDMLNELEVDGVRTPRVIFSFIGYDDETSDEMHAIAMEKLEAVSIRDLVASDSSLPEKFDLRTFVAGLRGYVEAMHTTHNLYHRDLHEGNVMIDLESGTARVIDFGDARICQSADSEDPYTDVGASGRPAVHYTDDLINVQHIKETLQRLVDRQARNS